MDFVNIIIYILASFGLIFTIVSMFDMYDGKGYIFSCKGKKDKLRKCELRVLIKEEVEENIDEIVQKIKTGNYDDIYAFACDVKVIKYN